MPRKSKTKRLLSRNVARNINVAPKYDDVDFLHDNLFMLHREVT